MQIDYLNYTRIMDFFGFVREKLHEEVPLYLKNILKHSGYDNRLSLAGITEREICQIEVFAKTQLKYALSKRQNVKYEEYYHIFSENIQDFIILPGHKKMLLAISEMCAEENNKLKLKDSFFNEDYNAKRRRIFNASTPCEDSSGETNDPINVDKLGEDSGRLNIHEESKYVFDICYQWIKKFSDTLKESDQNKVIETLHRLEIRISLSTVEDTIYFAFIKCSICQIEIKTQKRVRREGTSTWLISNFYKHFKCHFFEKPTEKKTGNACKTICKEALIYPEEENDSFVFEQGDFIENENHFKQEMQD